jgi:phosphatidate cytidylyltransferase
MLGIRNPFDDPLFVPSLRIAGLLFGLGFVLVLFFARQDLRAGLRGELGRRFIGWMIVAPLFLIATFVRGAVASIILIFFMARVVYEYVGVVGVERPYAIYLYSLIPITFVVAQFLPQLFFSLPAASILLLTLVPILTRRVDNLYLQLSYAGRGYLWLVWSISHALLLNQVAGNGMVILTGVGVALSDVMQYTIGKLIGRHIISPEVNPLKAWEGLLGDVLGAGLAVALFSFALPPAFGLPQRLVLVFIIGLGSAWGDLVSSLIKRGAAIKDWGDFLPGHGGLLDRANSMVIVIPLVYYFSYLVLAIAPHS